jgi:hypothetical protein
MDFKACLQHLQSCLENSPLIILGSGASASYGLPLMDALKDGILTDSSFSSSDFDVLKEALKTMNLEDALDNSNLPVNLSNQLRQYVWTCINEKDQAFFRQLSNGGSAFALVDLLHKVLMPTPNEATIITTNYDRLAEYAADISGATSITGFEGNLMRNLEFPTGKAVQARIRARERKINIWKVHGSLDWFITLTGKIVSYPLSGSIPALHTPLIIPPGKDKYSSTHNEPYRDIIAQADNAFARAGSFICIGYGFNDEHIQPKLITQIKTGKPIVVLCRSATDACKKYIISGDVKKYAVLEQDSPDKTFVTSSVNGGTPISYAGRFWELPDFIKTVWG